MSEKVSAITRYQPPPQESRDVSLERQMPPDMLGHHDAIEPHSGDVVRAAEPQVDVGVAGRVPSLGREERPVVPRPTDKVAHGRVLRDVVVARGDGHRDHVRGLRVPQRPLEPALSEAELRVAAVREAEVPYAVQGLDLSALRILVVDEV